MYTIIESNLFKEQAKKILPEDERLSFFTFLSKNPLAGAVIQSGNGLRKIRWAGSNRGKRGGIRVIYFNMLNDGVIVVQSVYAKNEKEDLSKKDLKSLLFIK